MVRFLFLVALISTAHAQDPEGIWLDARKAYQRKDFEQALTLLKGLEALGNATGRLPDVLLQMARTLDELGRPREALAYYGRYLEEPDPPGLNEKQIEARNNLEARTRERMKALRQALGARASVLCLDADLSLQVGFDQLPEQAWQACPATFDDLKAGPAELIVRLGGAEVWRRSIRLDNENALSVPALARVTVQASVPSIVRVDGHEHGRSPVQVFRGQPGAIRLDVLAEGHRPATSVVNLGEGDRWQVDVTMAKEQSDIWAWSAAGLGGVLVGLGFIAQASSFAADEAGDSALVETNNALAITSWSVGSAALVGGLMWALWPDKEPEIKMRRSR